MWPSRSSRVISPGPLAVNRFGSFTPAQVAFLTRAAALDIEVIVGLTWADGHAATAAANETIGYLRGLPGTITTAVNDHQDGSREIRRLEESLFSGVHATPGFELTGDVVFSEAAGISGEAQRIVRGIQEMEISGIPAHSIGIVFRRPETRYEFSPDDSGRIEADLLGTLEKMESGEFPHLPEFTQDVCGECPALGGLCPINPRRGASGGAGRTQR